MLNPVNYSQNVFHVPSLKDGSMPFADALMREVEPATILVHRDMFRGVYERTKFVAKFDHIDQHDN